MYHVKAKFMQRRLRKRWRLEIMGDWEIILSAGAVRELNFVGVGDDCRVVNVVVGQVRGGRRLPRRPLAGAWWDQLEKTLMMPYFESEHFDVIAL